MMIKGQRNNTLSAVYCYFVLFFAAVYSSSFISFLHCTVGQECLSKLENQANLVNLLTFLRKSNVIYDGNTLPYQKLIRIIRF